MRKRSIFAVCASVLLAVAASAGMFDSFVSVLDARAADPTLKPKQARAIEAARADVASADLLLSQAQAARRAERRIRGAFGKSDPLRTSAAQMSDSLGDALVGDLTVLEARRGKLGDEKAEKRLDTGVRLAQRDIQRAVNRRTTPAILDALVAAGVHLRDAYPPQPDFTLPDANPVSSTYQQPFTARGFAGKVSAWYFTRTT